MGCQLCILQVDFLRMVRYLSFLFLFDHSLFLSGLRTLSSKLSTLGLCWDLGNCLMVFGLWFSVLAGKGLSFVMFGCDIGVFGAKA